MKTALLIIGGFAALLVAFIAWRVWATAAGSRRLALAIMERISPVTSRLAAGETPSDSEIRRLAESRETRQFLHDALLRAGRVDLLPARFRRMEAVAEGDMAFWLAHPNELGAFPDELEQVAVVTTLDHHDAPRGVRYVVLRFRMRPPHWAAKNGWMAGVAGPYAAKGDAAPGAPGTFSRFEAVDSRTPEEHAHLAHDMLARRGWKPDRSET